MRPAYSGPSIGNPPMLPINPPQKAPYDDLLTKLLVVVTVGTLLFCIGIARLKEVWMHISSDAFREPQSPSRTQPKPSPPILKASDHHSDGKYHLLLAATGSVATIKIPLILHALSQHRNLSTRLILSDSARQFLQGQSAEQPTIASLSAINNVDGVYFDEHEWTKPWVRGDSILHIELRRWADLMVVAPLSANGLAKISQGMSDNLVSSVIRAWDFNGLIDGARPGVALPYDMGKTKKELATLPEAFKDGRKKGIIVAPAMNTAMWSHPVTAKQLAVLEQEWGVGNGGWFEVLRPMEKMLACGDTGSGAMRDWKDIVGVIEERLSLEHDAGAHVKKE
jgi:phosphopantothenoylcysteine decarboxylase